MEAKQSFIRGAIDRFRNMGRQTYTREKTETEKLEEIRQNNTKSGTASFSRYTPDEKQTDSRPREMASGREVYDGAIASGDRSIPLGTEIYVPQHKRTYILEDRMNQRYDATSTPYFDIPFAGNSRKEYTDALKFGRQNLDFVIKGHDGRKNTNTQYTPVPDPKATSTIALYKKQNEKK